MYHWIYTIEGAKCIGFLSISIYILFVSRLKTWQTQLTSMTIRRMKRTLLQMISLAGTETFDGGVVIVTKEHVVANIARPCVTVVKSLHRCMTTNKARFIIFHWKYTREETHRETVVQYWSLSNRNNFRFRCGSNPVPVNWFFVVISPCFAIFKNVVHSLKPGSKLCATFLNIVKYLKTVRCGCGYFFFKLLKCSYVAAVCTHHSQLVQHYGNRDFHTCIS